MKKILLIAIATLCFVCASAEGESGNTQTSNERKVTFSANMGVGGLATNPYRYKEDNFDVEGHLALQLGGTIAVPIIGQSHSLMTGLTFTREHYSGCTEPYGHGMWVYDEKATAYYAQVPLCWRFNLQKKQTKWNIDLGVYAAYGIGGKTTDTYIDPTSESLSGKRKFDTFGDSAEHLFKPFDFGLHIGMNTLINQHWTIGVTTNLGLINISNPSNTGRYERNVWELTAGYLF